MNRPLMFDLSPSEAKIVLLDVLTALSTPENLEQARAVAGNDMLKQMQTVFPVSVQIEAQVLAQHGLLGTHGDGSGSDPSLVSSASATTSTSGSISPGEAVVQFHQLLNVLAPQDSEIDALFKQLKMRLIPSS